jgi:peptide subunit release factor 1 (eRF1)
MPNESWLVDFFQRRQRWNASSGVRLAVAGERGVRCLVMEAQRVVEQADLGSERHRLGRLAHERTGDSILSITKR